MDKDLGIIGCGAVTQRNYVKTLPMFSDIKVKCVHDIDDSLSKLVAKQLDAKATTKEELFDKCKIIIIATPPSTHFSLVREALSMGKRVICEKPFVGNVEEALGLLDIAKKSNSELFVAHFRRLYPSVQLARELVDSGVLGQIVSIEAYEGGRFSWKTKSGYVYKDPYGGVLFDTGSHTIDMALYIAKLDSMEMLASLSSIRKDKVEPAHDVEANLVLNSPIGEVDFRIKLSRRQMLANKIRITGTNGFIDIPTLISNYVRLGSKNSSTVLYSKVNYEDLMDCFALQFKYMFYDVIDTTFNGLRFVNLTKILEIISKD